MNELELWTLNEVKELLYFSSTIDFFFLQENPDLDVVNHCLIEGNFGFVTHATIIENPDKPTFHLSMSIDFYNLVEVGKDEEDINDREIVMYLHVRDRVQDTRTGIGSLPHSLQDWDFGDEETFPLVYSNIEILDPALELVKVSQKYIIGGYVPFLSLPPSGQEEELV